MKQLAWFLLLLLVAWGTGLALEYWHYRRIRARKLAELNAYWDSLIAGDAVARPPWLLAAGVRGVRRPWFEQRDHFDITQ